MLPWGTCDFKVPKEKEKELLQLRNDSAGIKAYKLHASGSLHAKEELGRGTRFHIPDLSLISGSPGDKASTVPGPRYAGNLSRQPRLPSLSPCTGSRLPGLTR